jgi:hypothetical protein
MRGSDEREKRTSNKCSPIPRPDKDVGIGGIVEQVLIHGALVRDIRGRLVR